MSFRHFVILFTLLASGCTAYHIAPMPERDAAVMPRDAGVPSDAFVSDSGPPPVDAFVIEGVTAEISDETPFAATIPRNASGVFLAVFAIRAGLTPVTLTGLRVHRFGVGAASDFQNLFLLDLIAGNRLTVGRSIDPITNIVSFNGLNVSIPARSQVLMMVQGDVSAASSGGQHGFEILDASGITVEGADVSGSFPVRGNIFTIGSVLAARLEIRRGTTPPDPTVGAIDAEVSNFTLTAVGGDIEVFYLRVLQQGSIASSDFLPRTFIDDVLARDTWEGETLSITSDPRLVVMDGSTVTVSIRANISGPAGRTIRTYVEYPVDVYTTDLSLGSRASVDQSDFDTDSYIEVTVR